MLHTIIRGLNFFEHHTRRGLRHYPVVYTFIASIAGIIFLRGVWKIIDGIFGALPDFNMWGESLISFAVASVIIFLCGLILSFFVTDTVVQTTTEDLSAKVDLLEAHIGYLDKKLAQKDETLHNH